MIKYGSIEYFSLLELYNSIKGWKYDKFGLENLDKLKLEIEIKIKASEHEYHERIRKSRTEETTG
jgi:hypothetical protein